MRGHRSQLFSRPEAAPPRCTVHGAQRGRLLILLGLFLRPVFARRFSLVWYALPSPTGCTVCRETCPSSHRRPEQASWRKLPPYTCPLCTWHCCRARALCNVRLAPPNLFFCFVFFWARTSSNDHQRGAMTSRARQRLCSKSYSKGTELHRRTMSRDKIERRWTRVIFRTPRYRTVTLE